MLDDWYKQLEGKFICLESELAAMMRQFGRAADAADAAAVKVETLSICSRIRLLLVLHVEFRIAMEGIDRVWLDGDDDRPTVERTAPNELRASGRIWCSFPDTPEIDFSSVQSLLSRQKWTEPFAAELRHSSTTNELERYTIWFASRATMLDQKTVRRLIADGEVVKPRTPDIENDWAYVFRMGERA